MKTRNRGDLVSPRQGPYKYWIGHILGREWHGDEDAGYWSYQVQFDNGDRIDFDEQELEEVS